MGPYRPITCRWRNAARLPECLSRILKKQRNGRTNLRRRVSRSEEHTSELQSLMRTSYAVFCLKKNSRSLHTMCQRRPPYTAKTPNTANHQSTNRTNSDDKTKIQSHQSRSTTSNC